MKKIFAIGLMLIICGQANSQADKELLVKISDKLLAIKNASYTLKANCGLPDDSVFNKSISTIEVYTRNENDDFLKSNFYVTLDNESDKISYSYTNGIKRKIDWKKNQIIIDSLNYDFLPYKVAKAPVLIGIHGIIDYSIAHFDSVLVDIKRLSDTTIIRLSFPNKIIEMINYIPWVVQCPQIVYDKAMARYTIWIDNSKLPFKILREVHTERCLLEIEKLQYDTVPDKNVLSGLYYPDNFEVIDIKNRPLSNSHVLENKKAPHWTLENPMNGKHISLSNIKSDLILLQFTGIGCGHCKESIPFLKQLSTKYDRDRLEIISIETFVDNNQRIKEYLDKLGIDYTYLKSDNETKSTYDINGVPVFFLINQDRLIEKVYVGFKSDVTDKEIINQINEMSKNVSAHNASNI